MNKLLLLDDEMNVLRALRRVLSREPYSIEIFTRPEEALARAREVEFAMVMSDYRMPEMSGVEFLARFKDVQPNAKRLIVTGYADFDGQQRAVEEVGVVAIIRKPWNDEELKAVLAAALECDTDAIESSKSPRQ